MIIEGPDLKPGEALRVGVIGTGYLGHFHAQKLRAMAGVELTGVADQNPQRARAVGRELGVADFADFRDLLPRLHAAIIAVPTVAHFGVARECLEAGVHILLEKPMTATLPEADALIALAEDRGRVLQVGHLKRFHPAVLALQDSGLLKTPRFIESARLAPFKNRALDVDVILDLMIHDVDLILNFIGAEVEVVAVEAIGAPVVTRHIDLANARLKFANGTVATITASRVAREATRRIRLFQDDAFISLDFITKDIHLVRRRNGPMALDGATADTFTPEVIPIRDHDTLEAEVRAFCAAVRQGRPPVVSGHEGRRALQVVEAIRSTVAQFARQAALL
ncbi:MAG: Gfo/Idh/MocA family oxidoreductase [Magnetococcales bacterium]|nr:Gfo/Idh/MocA family oxidoreductase [Magnetococcales bacterium]